LSRFEGLEPFVGTNFDFGRLQPALRERLPVLENSHSPIKGPQVRDYFTVS